MGAVCDRAFEVVERLSGAGSEAAIAAELRRAGEAFGYDNFFMTGLPPGPEERLEAYALVSGWPDEWLSRYAGHDYVHVDPVIHQLRRSTMPFMWHEAPYSRDDRGAVRVMAEAPAFGLTAGITIPIHEATGGTAGVCFSARHQVDWGAETRAALHLVAIYAHARAVELLKAPSA